MPREILHLLGSAHESASGIASIVANQAACLDAAENRIHAWFLDGDGPLADRLASQGISVVDLRWRGGARDPAGALRFLARIAGRDFCVVHQHAGGRGVRRLVRLASRAKIVAHLHGRIDEAAGTSPVAIEVATADAVIAASRAIARALVPPAKATVIYAGVPVPPAALRPLGNDFVVGTACRLVPLKGIPILLEAIARLAREFPGLRLEIAGSGSLENELRSQSIALGIEERVGFLGWHNDVATLHRTWDAFCMPSLEEGFGLAAVEAMASGLPVVASRIGGLEEIVVDGVTGSLVPAGDVDALAGALRGILEKPDLARKMGVSGARRASSHFSSRRMTQEMLALYDSLLPGEYRRGLESG